MANAVYQAIANLDNLLLSAWNDGRKAKATVEIIGPAGSAAIIARQRRAFELYINEKGRPGSGRPFHIRQEF